MHTESKSDAESLSLLDSESINAWFFRLPILTKWNYRNRKITLYHTIPVFLCFSLSCSVLLSLVRRLPVNFFSVNTTITWKNQLTQLRSICTRSDVRSNQISRFFFICCYSSSRLTTTRSFREMRLNRVCWFCRVFFSLHL